jgi:hypothetical protein
MVFNLTHDGTLNAYDYQFFYSAMINNRLSIVPGQNLISNIGWGAGSTNTANRNPEMGMKTFPMAFPMKHPTFMVPNEQADNFTENLMFAKPLSRKIRNRLGRIFAGASGQ